MVTASSVSSLTDPVCQRKKSGCIDLHFYIIDPLFGFQGICKESFIFPAVISVVIGDLGFILVHMDRCYTLYASVITKFNRSFGKHIEVAHTPAIIGEG